MYIKSLAVPGIIADDYMGRSPSARLADSKYFVDLVRALNAGQDCVVCDVRFCRAGQREALEAMIRECAPDATVEWRFFENEPAQCLKNVRRRARMNITHEERSIRDLSPLYKIPEDANILPVWRPPEDR
jgi:hypothetical protein